MKVKNSAKALRETMANITIIEKEIADFTVLEKLAGNDEGIKTKLRNMRARYDADYAHLVAKRDRAVLRGVMDNPELFTLVMNKLTA